MERHCGICWVHFAHRNPILSIGKIYVGNEPAHNYSLDIYKKLLETYHLHATSIFSHSIETYRSAIRMSIIDTSGVDIHPEIYPFAQSIQNQLLTKPQTQIEYTENNKWYPHSD